MTDVPDFNSVLVQEVIDFVNKDNFLQGFSCNSTDQLIVETDFKKATNYAIEQLIDHANLCWLDIRQQENAKVYGKLYQYPDHSQLSERIYKLSEPFLKQLKFKIPAVYQEVIEDILGDMCCILENRLINGLTDNLFEQMFQVYKRGGWPCGWKGNYPEGKMIVFSPPPKTE